MLTLFIASVAVLAYVYVGYPLLLRLIVRLRGPRPVRREPIAPAVTLVISAFNEAHVIRQKIENSLALDYPADRLEVLVVSDASTDGTDEIVREYAGQRVTLVRQDERLGKTAGLNRVVPAAKGEIVVFSDANAMYEPSAVRMLVRNFADPAVGCVTGEARYVKEDRSAADVGERAYWDYEIQIKRRETAVGSMVGGDGAIYAIRRHLWRELPPDAINDFLNPLQIVAAGHRCVYEPEAVAFEETAGEFRREYQRRIRIVSRSWRAVFQAPGALNPARVGLFALSLVSHKVLRWLTPFFLLTALAAFVGLVSSLPHPLRVALLAASGAALALLALWRGGRRMLALVAYYGLLNAASLVGVVRGSLGRVSGVWTPSRQSTDLGDRRGFDVAAEIGVWLAFLAVVGSAGWWWPPLASALTVGSLAVLALVYIGYPIALAVVRPVLRRTPVTGDVTPSATVLIPAYNEAAVMAQKLSATLALDYPRDRLAVLVVSDGSTDRTADIVGEFASQGVRLISLATRAGKMNALDVGLREIETDLVVFTDANAFPQPDALRTLVRSFADEEVGAVSGDVVLVGERAAFGIPEDYYYQLERWLQRAESDVGSMIGVDGAWYAVRRPLVAAPPPDTILDDITIAMGVVSQGRRVVLEPRSLATEQGSRTAREEFIRKSRVIAGSVRFMRLMFGRPSWPAQVWISLVFHKVLRWLSPLFLALLTASAPALVERRGMIALVSVLAVVITLGLLGLNSTLRRRRLIGLAYYFCLVQAAAAIGLVRGLMGRQRVTWERFDRSAVVQP